jgi:nucleotide-binding universal stress UspA family protein
VGTIGAILLADGSRGGDGMFERIVVGTDGSESATSALKDAARLAALFSGELHVVSGYHPKSALSVTGAGSGVEPWMVGSEYEVEGILRDAADIARREKIEVITHHEAGNPAKALVTIADQVDADLIVVGNRGMKGLKGKVLGSVPNEVSHRASCAVLILDTT